MLHAKDYVLHFRCYVALGNVKDAEKLFQQLDTKADVQGHGPTRLNGFLSTSCSGQRLSLLLPVRNLHKAFHKPLPMVMHLVLQCFSWHLMDFPGWQCKCSAINQSASPKPPQATTLMLNLLLLTCINCGRSERAFEILWLSLVTVPALRFRLHESCCYSSCHTSKSHSDITRHCRGSQVSSPGRKPTNGSSG